MRERLRFVESPFLGRLLEGQEVTMFLDLLVALGGGAGKIMIDEIAPKHYYAIIHGYDGPRDELSIKRAINKVEKKYEIELEVSFWPD